MTQKSTICAQDYIDILSTSAKRLELHNFAFGISFSQGTPTKLACSYNPEWQDRYFQEGLLWKDPTILVGLTASEVLTWDEIAAANRESSVFSLASDYGLDGGVTIPINTQNHKSLISFARGGLSTDATEVYMLQSLATYAARSFAIGEIDDCPLTLPQLITLQLIAEGLTLKEIANIFGIGLSGVRRRIEGVYEKLDARNAAHATHIGHRANLIR